MGSAQDYRWEMGEALRYAAAAETAKRAAAATA
jgi:hypothetical protein